MIWTWFALLVLGGATEKAQAAEAMNAAKALCPNCNVLLVSMDALQAKHVSHLGYPRKTTPHLDRWAQAGTSFAQAISPSSWTVPTYLSVFTSTYPSAHGLTNRYERFNEKEKKVRNFAKSRPELVTMAEVFRGAGYRTGAFTGDAGISAVLGYDKGFEIYTDDVQFGGLDLSAPKALDWVGRTEGKPYFLFVHGYDSHGQFRIPEGTKAHFPMTGGVEISREIQARLREDALAGKDVKPGATAIEAWRAWYDNKIRDADERLGRFLAEMEKRGLLKNTILVVISDHGTEFFEHGGIDHGHTLYDELIQVPLVIVVPGVKGGRVVKEMVSTLDVLPTLLAITGLEMPAKKQMVGRSLVPAVLGKSLPPRDVFSETDLRNFTHKRAIRTSDGWKYILTLENGVEELYHWKRDPKETKNLVTKEPKRAEALRQRLMAHIRTALGPNGSNRATECLPVYEGQCTKGAK